MATSILTRLALQTTRLSTIALRHQILTVCPKRSFSASTTVFSDRKYTEKHEWVQVTNAAENLSKVGISNHAQESLGEIIYVELPKLETTVEKDDEVGCVESVKAASDIYCPVSGEIVKVNDQLSETPGLLNTSPLDEGWMFQVKMSKPEELDDLMSEEEYKKFLSED